MFAVFENHAEDKTFCSNHWQLVEVGKHDGVANRETKGEAHVCSLK